MSIPFRSPRQVRIFRQGGVSLFQPKQNTDMTPAWEKSIYAVSRLLSYRGDVCTNLH